MGQGLGYNKGQLGVRGETSIFPFMSSTPVFPMWTLGSFVGTPWEARSAIQASLLEYDRGNYTYTPSQWGPFSWRPTEQTNLRNDLKSIGAISPEGVCTNPAPFLESFICPAGYRVRTSGDRCRERVSCASGFLCFCRPCIALSATLFVENVTVGEASDLHPPRFIKCGAVGGGCDSIKGVAAGGAVRLMVREDEEVSGGRSYRWEVLGGFSAMPTDGRFAVMPSSQGEPLLPPPGKRKTRNTNPFPRADSTAPSPILDTQNRPRDLCPLDTPRRHCLAPVPLTHELAPHGRARLLRGLLMPPRPKR